MSELDTASVSIGSSSKKSDYDRLMDNIRIIASGTITFYGTKTFSSTCIFSATAIFANGMNKPYSVFMDVKSTSSFGGAFTASIWKTRTLNTSTVNTITGCSLSSNRVTLPPGKYYFNWKCPAVQTQSHKTRLRKITPSPSATIAVGTSEYAGSDNQNSNNSSGNYIVTLTATSTLELQHRCSYNSLSWGMGVPSGFDKEVYSVLEIEKLL